MLHLHGFHDRHRLADAHGVADLDGAADDGALQRRAQGRRALGPRELGGGEGGRRRRGRHGPLGAALAVGEHRQRVDGVDLGPGAASQPDAGDGPVQGQFGLGFGGLGPGRGPRLGLASRRVRHGRPIRLRLRRRLRLGLGGGLRPGLGRGLDLGFRDSRPGGRLGLGCPGRFLRLGPGSGLRCGPGFRVSPCRSFGFGPRRRLGLGSGFRLGRRLRFGFGSRRRFRFSLGGSLSLDPRRRRLDLRLRRRPGGRLGLGLPSCFSGRRLGRQLGDVLLDVARVDRALAGREALRERPQQRDVAGDAGQAERAERAAGLLGGGRQRLGLGDHLGQQRVVANAGAVAGVAKPVDTDPRPGGRRVVHDLAAGRAHLTVGGDGLEVDPRLDRDAGGGGDRALAAQAQRLQRGAVGDLELQPHQVEAGDLLGHRVLHLQPRIGLDEGEARLALQVVDQELDRAQALVTGRIGHLHRRGLQRGAHGVVDADRRGDLDQLLALALQAALAVPQVHHRAGPVADDLHLDVTGSREELFDVNPAVAERRLGLGGAARERLGELVLVGHQTHAAAAAAGERLQHDRAAVAEQFQERARLGQRGAAAGAGQRRDVEPSGQAQRRGLVAKQRQDLRRRTDEGQPGVGAVLGEGAVLAQEAIAGMHRLAAGLLRDIDDLTDVEIGGRAGPLQRHRRIGALGVQRLGVILGEDGDGGDPHLRGGAGDADGDFATVGDQQLLQRTSLGAFADGWPAPRSMPSSASTSSVCSPRTGAGRVKLGRSPS